MKKFKKILIIYILLVLVFSNISFVFGLTSEEKKKAEEITKFYSKESNYVFTNEKHTGFKNKTNTDIEKDLNFLNEIKDDNGTNVGRGTANLQYKIKSTITLLNSFLESQEQEKTDDKEREENNNNVSKQEDLKNYTVEQMVEYYENHNNSLASLPKTGNVRETWISKLENTEEYKEYKEYTENPRNGSTTTTKRKTGEKYSLMIASIKVQEKQESNDNEREENNKDTGKQEELKNYTIEQMVEYYESHNNSLASLPDNGDVRKTWISKLKNTEEYKKYIKSTSQRDEALDWYKTGEEYYQMIASMDSTSNDLRSKDKTGDDKDDESQTIYQYPSKEDSTSSGSLDDMIGDADKFVDSTDGTAISASSLQDFSKTFYNIFLTIGIIVATLVGSILGIKFMLGGAEEKAHIKELLVPYIVGCIVIFGAFAIWKIVVTILSNSLA